MPAGARCVWSKSELSRQTCFERLDRFRGNCTWGAHRLFAHWVCIEDLRVGSDRESAQVMHIGVCTHDSVRVCTGECNKSLPHLQVKCAICHLC